MELTLSASQSVLVARSSFCSNMFLESERHAALDWKPDPGTVDPSAICFWSILADPGIHNGWGQGERWSSPSLRAGQSSGLSTLCLSTNFKRVLRHRHRIEKKPSVLQSELVTKALPHSWYLALHSQLKSAMHPVRLPHSWDQLALLRRDGDVVAPTIWSDPPTPATPSWRGVFHPGSCVVPGGGLSRVVCLGLPGLVQSGAAPLSDRTDWGLLETLPEFGSQGRDYRSPGAAHLLAAEL
ncbi:hypothetical protein A6R68_14023, partial [Neotoma lepida]